MPLARFSLRLSPFYLACQAGGWGAWAVIYALITMGYVPHTPRALFELFFSYFLNAVYGALVTHLIYRRLAAWVHLPMPRLLLRLVPSMAAGALAMVIALVLINDRLLHMMGGHVGIREAMMFYVNLSFLLVGWTVLYALIRLARGRRAAERERAQLELAVRDARFRSLAAQVQPHFSSTL